MRFLAFVLVVMATFASFGTTGDDSVNVRFRAGQRHYDPSLGDNRVAMDGFIAKVKEAAEAGNIERVVVRGYASPDGMNSANVRLAYNRCATIAAYIADKAGISRNLIEENPGGIDWSELRRLVDETPDVPAREKILDILDNTPLWVYNSEGKIVGGRKKSLMDLQGGRPYNWMLANLFPQMRNAVAVTLFVKEQPAPVEAVVVEEADNLQAMTDTVMEQPEQAVVEEPVATGSTAAVAVTDADSRFALKTNLLGYAVLMPNIEAEWMFVDRWSAALEVQGAWYSKTPPHKVYRIATIMPEVRYWVIERSRWHGMYVGVFGGVGEYDLSNGKKDGHEGEGAMVGLSTGYMWPISKHLSLEAGIGLGYLHVRDKRYKPADGHYLYQFSKDINYFGPLRLKLSLVWRIPSKKRIEK